jgi:hypothetical protein
MQLHRECSSRSPRSRPNLSLQRLGQSKAWKGSTGSFLQFFPPQEGAHPNEQAIAAIR